VDVRGAQNAPYGGNPGKPATSGSSGTGTSGRPTGTGGGSSTDSGRSVITGTPVSPVTLAQLLGIQ
jgi:hypothetical protein